MRCERASLAGAAARRGSLAGPMKRVPPPLPPRGRKPTPPAFKPAATGAIAASLVISDDGSTATQTVTLAGTGAN